VVKGELTSSHINIQDLTSSLDEQIEYFKDNKLNKSVIGQVWYQRLRKNLKTIKSQPELIHKFNKLALTGIDDNKVVRANLLAYIDPRSRANKYYYDDLFNALIENHPSAIHLLQKYPADNIGERGIYKKKYKGKVFTLSVYYLYHLEKLAIFNEKLKNKLSPDFTSCDIGSNAGIHSMLMKKEYPNASFVLIDFPEQLIYAHYYLRRMFKDAKIATFSDIKDLEVITRSFIKSFDFVLVPSYMAKKLQKGSVDVVTNFASFGEMSREWFDYYMKSEFFKHAKFFFHLNRIHKDYKYGYAITVLDYPHSDFETILFEVSPLFQHVYVVDKRFPLFVRKIYHQPLFNFVGKRKRIPR
jgi:putative sugar O-methyltransferase